MERGRKRRSNGEIIVSQSERRDRIELCCIVIGSRRRIRERRRMIKNRISRESERLNGP